MRSHADSTTMHAVMSHADAACHEKAVGMETRFWIRRIEAFNRECTNLLAINLPPHTPETGKITEGISSRWADCPLEPRWRNVLHEL